MSKDIIGIKVNHDSFGIGEIIDFSDHKISVRFDSGKISRFVLKNLGNNFIDIIDAESEENKRIFKEIISSERLFEIQEKVFNVLEREYKFEGFVHYTAYNNLESIFDSGCLYSRNDMKNNRLLWKDVASESVLGNTSDKVKNCTRFFYGFNTPITYNFEKTALEEKTEMVAMVFNKKMILDNKAYFFEKSAAISHSKPASRMGEIEKFRWDLIFERGAMTDHKEERKAYRDAEIIIPHSVDLKYLKYIYIKSYDYLDMATKEFGNKCKFVKGKVGDRGHFQNI